MPTAIGLVFITAGLYFAIWRPQLLFGFLLFSAIFPATSAVTFGSLWIMPYNLLAFIFIVSQFLRRNDGRPAAAFPGKSFLLAFAAVGFISALVLPFIFAGTPVYSPRLGSSDEVFTTFPLVFNTGNVAQGAYLVLNVLVVFAAASAIKTESVWRGVNAAFYCLTGTIAVELACMLLGIAFPYTLIENNPDRASLVARVLDPSSRLQGTCGEPSYSGLVLVIFFSAFFFRYYTGKTGGVRALISVVALLLIRSGSAFVGLAVVAATIVALNPPIRIPFILRIGRFFRLLPLIVIVGAALSSTLIREIVQEWVLDKPTTGSYEHRTTMDNYSLVLIRETYGLGVGVGSFRPSSLWASLFGSVGIAGSLLFVLLCVQIAFVVPRDKAWLRWSFLAALIDMGIAIPDINQPILWALIALIVYVGQTDVETRSMQEAVTLQATLGEPSYLIEGMNSRASC